MTAAAALVAAALAAAAGGDPGVRTPADPAYTLQLRADASATHWRGREQVTFRNAGAAPLARVYLRLWGNGRSGCADPAVRVTGLTGGTAGDLDVDCTALPVDLPAPLASGASTTIAFQLAIDVPARVDRFGRIGREVLVGNAVPLLAIDDADGWHLDPYVAFGESFYSQVGSFDVTFDTPAGVAVAATGTEQSDTAQGGRVVRHVVADDVRDLAWAAGPLRERDRTGPGGVRVRVWYPPAEPLRDVDRSLRRSVAALADYDVRFGAYPYAELDVVLAAFTAFGGMEYPQLVMTQPAEASLAHEIAHQWWYGTVGDDQYRAPWLDEAFATYSEASHDHVLTGLCHGRPIFPARGERVTASMRFWQSHVRDYGVVVYTDGACALNALAHALGQHAFDALLHDYAVANRYGWSTTAAFMAAAQAVVDRAARPVDLRRLWATERIS